MNLPAPARIGLGNLEETRQQRKRVILVDTSTGWSSSARPVVGARVDAELDGDIVICYAIRMEVLAGA